MTPRTTPRPAHPRDPGLRTASAPPPPGAAVTLAHAAPGTWEVAAVLGLVAVCAALRVVHLDALPVYTDEAIYTRAAQIVAAHPGAATWLVAMSYGGAPPLFSWLAAPLVRLWPDPLLAGRLTSAAIGTLALPATWAVGRVVGGRAVGLLAAALYALCPFAVFYSRMAVLDGLVMACGAGALYGTLRLLRRPGPGVAVALGLCLAAGMLSKIFAASLLLLPLLAVILARRGARAATGWAALAAVVLGLLPLVGLLLVPHTGGLLFATHGHLRTGLDRGGHAPLDVLGYLAPLIARQLAIWATALWLYLTPPIVVLALLGLWAARARPEGRLVGLWALLGGLPPAIVPNVFLAPRYFVYIAVPVAILAACGLLLLAGVIGRRVLPGLRPWPLAWCAAALAVAPAVAADATLVSVPARTPLLAFDRWQYVTGWPSGYAVMTVVAYLRARAATRPITVICANYDPPRLQLRLLLGRDASIHVVAVALPTLHARRAAAGGPLALVADDFDTGHRRVFAATARRPVYLVVLHYRGHAVPTDYHYFAHDFPLLADRGVLRPVLHVPHAARGAAGYGFAPSSLDVYRLVGS